MDENEENVDYEQQTPSDVSSAERRPKNKLKNAGKKVGKNISDAFKQGMKAIWKALPLKVKLIIAAIVGVIVFLACIYVVYSDYFVSASEETISNYYGEDGDKADTKGGQLYNSTGSLLFATSKLYIVRVYE